MSRAPKSVPVGSNPEPSKIKELTNKRKDRDHTTQLERKVHISKSLLLINRQTKVNCFFQLYTCLFACVKCDLRSGLSYFQTRLLHTITVFNSPTPYLSIYKSTKLCRTCWPWHPLGQGGQSLTQTSAKWPQALLVCTF